MMDSTVQLLDGTFELIEILVDSRQDYANQDMD